MLLRLIPVTAVFVIFAIMMTVRKWGVRVSYAILILSIIFSFIIGLILGAIFFVFVIASLPLFIIYGVVILVLLIIAVVLCCRIGGR